MKMVLLRHLRTLNGLRDLSLPETNVLIEEVGMKDEDDDPPED